MYKTLQCFLHQLSVVLLTIHSRKQLIYTPLLFVGIDLEAVDYLDNDDGDTINVVFADPWLV